MDRTRFVEARFMHLLARLPWFKRLVVALMLGAFLPAIVAAYACQTLCASLSASAREGHEEHGLADSTVHAMHELPASNHAAHLRHGGVCQVANMVYLASTESRPLPDVHMVMLTQPVEAAFVSLIWPPPLQPPRV